MHMASRPPTQREQELNQEYPRRLTDPPNDVYRPEGMSLPEIIAKLSSATFSDNHNQASNAQQRLDNISGHDAMTQRSMTDIARALVAARLSGRRPSGR